MSWNHNTWYLISTIGAVFIELKVQKIKPPKLVHEKDRNKK